MLGFPEDHLEGEKEIITVPSRRERVLALLIIWLPKNLAGCVLSYFRPAEDFVLPYIFSMKDPVFYYGSHDVTYNLNRPPGHYGYYGKAGYREDQLVKKLKLFFDVASAQHKVTWESDNILLPRYIEVYKNLSGDESKEENKEKLSLFYFLEHASLFEKQLTLFYRMPASRLEKPYLLPPSEPHLHDGRKKIVITDKICYCSLPPSPNPYAHPVYSIITHAFLRGILERANKDRLVFAVKPLILIPPKSLFVWSLMCSTLLISLRGCFALVFFIVILIPNTLAMDGCTKTRNEIMKKTEPYKAIIGGLLVGVCIFIFTNDITCSAAKALETAFHVMNINFLFDNAREGCNTLSPFVDNVAQKKEKAIFIAPENDEETVPNIFR